MNIEVEYWDVRAKDLRGKFCIYRVKESVPVKIENWKGSKEEIFKRFYKENNSLRYCNGSSYKFKDDLLQKEYINWLTSLSESTRFQMFYGNGVVD